MSGKHTPGPWGLSNEGTKYKIYGEKVKCSQFGELVTPIASTYFASDLDQANARLIAAAPDLYACVKSFLLNWPQFGTDEEVNGGDLVDWLAEQVPYWKDALAKAKGLEPRT